MYTFLDLIVMADGTTVSRVWDTSPYPKHYLYVNGTQRADNGFDRGTGPALGGRGKVKNGEWIRNQDVNRERFAPWWKQIRFGHVTPFRPFKPKAYENKWDNDDLTEPAHVGTPQDHPVMVEGDDGSRLSASDLIEEYDEPLFPWKNVI